MDHPLLHLARDRKIILVTGKGGIGKTLTAATLAHLASSMGRRVCIVESRQDDQIPPLFGRPPQGHIEQQLTPRIFSINIDSSANFRDFVVKHLGFETLFDTVFNRSMVSSFVKMLPGVADLTLLGRLYFMSALAPEPFDLVIFDGYASGHFLKLLETPRAVFESGLIGPVIRETERVLAYFNHPGQTSIVQVATQEPLVLSELEDFLPRLNAAGCSHVECIVLNRFAKNRPQHVEPAWQAAYQYLYRYQQTTTPRSLQSIPVATFQEMGAIDEPFTQETAFTLIDQRAPS